MSNHSEGRVFVLAGAWWWLVRVAVELVLVAGQRRRAPAELAAHTAPRHIAAAAMCILLRASHRRLSGRAFLGGIGMRPSGVVITTSFTPSESSPYINRGEGRVVDFAGAGWWFVRAGLSSWSLVAGQSALAKSAAHTAPQPPPRCVFCRTLRERAFWGRSASTIGGGYCNSIYS